MWQTESAQMLKSKRAQSIYTYTNTPKQVRPNTQTHARTEVHVWYG